VITLSTEEILDSCGGDDRQEPTRFARKIRDRMWDLTWKPKEPTCLPDTVLVTHLIRQSTLEDHDHFVLALVYMNRWSAVDHDTFDDREEPV